MPIEWTQTAYLSVLTRAPADMVSQLAEAIIPKLGDITVLKNQTGLVMLPYTDSAYGTVFHLGEVLVAEAHIRVAGGVEGYGMILSRDVTFAMAVAVLDAAMQSGVETDTISDFVTSQSQAQADDDAETLRKVNATRVEMETF